MRFVATIEHLVVVHGFPGAGKTWLSERIAPLLGYPLLSRDRILASLFDLLPAPEGTSAEEWSKTLGTATFGVFLELAGSLGPRLIIDAHFQARFGGDADVCALAESPTQIYVHAPAEVLLDRHLARFDDRRAAHRVREKPTIDAIRDALPYFAPLDIPGPVLTIDTSDVVDVVAVAHWVRSHAPSEG